MAVVKSIKDVVVNKQHNKGIIKTRLLPCFLRGESMEQFDIKKSHYSGQKEYPNFLTAEACATVTRFHKQMPEYEPTPLVGLSALAAEFGVKQIYVKDESFRFGLNAFKSLGGTYAIDTELKKKGINGIGQVFVTATDGNHGKGVAWAAYRVGGEAHVFMPKGSKEARVQAIAGIGATKVTVTELNYDDTVQFAANYAKTHGYTLVQDTGFEGYEEIPKNVAKGYMTMAKEAIDSMAQDGISAPTHVFLQAGVGTMAGAVLGYYANIFKDKLPITTIVEPMHVACFYESNLEGKPVSIEGHQITDMAGLNCGTPNIYIWPIVRDFASFYAKCADEVTYAGMRMLANPIDNDRKVVAGESAAVSIGLLAEICANADLKEQMSIDENAVVLVFSTEGATDPANYERIVGVKP